MLKWIGGMQAFLLVMGLFVVTTILGIYDNSFFPLFVGTTILVCSAYFFVMTIFVMPVIEKEKKEKHQAVLDKHKDVIGCYTMNINHIYEEIARDLLEKGYSEAETSTVLTEIFHRTFTTMEKTNEK